VVAVVALCLAGLAGALASAATPVATNPAGGPAANGEVPIPAPPARWATDGVGFLSEPARAELDARLQAFEAASGRQVLLWIGHTTGRDSIEAWAARAFAAWKVGRKGLDDGVALFIMSDDRKVRIEVGYGLEASLPDVRASAIIRDGIVPRLKAGDRDGAARAGVDGILATLGGDGGAAAPIDNQPQPAALSWAEIIVGGLLGLFLLGFLITHPGLAVLFLMNLGSRGGRGGGWGGGGSSGGGGFSGGGGRSGGGGASGSW
jgi:uncharacterized protein